MVPHNLVELSISLSSFSGFPATMNGQVCGKKKQEKKRKIRVQVCVFYFYFIFWFVFKNVILDVTLFNVNGTISVGLHSCFCVCCFIATYFIYLYTTPPPSPFIYSLRCLFFYLIIKVEKLHLNIQQGV